MKYKDKEVPISNCNFNNGVAIIPLPDGSIDCIPEDGATESELSIIQQIKEDVESRPEPEPIEPNIDEIKQSLITESKTKLDTYLVGHPMLFTNDKYYSVTREKQNLLNNAIAVYQMKVQSGDTTATIKWNATGEECTEWTLEEISTLALSIANYVEPLISYQQSIEVQINSCITKEELDSVAIDYETVI